MSKQSNQWKRICFQPRDLALLRGLFESRIMTAPHIAEVFFAGKREAAKKRLQKIKAAGFINERPRRAYEPSVLFLTRKAFQFLQTRGILAEYPPFSKSLLEKRAHVSDLTIRHELDVVDVKAAFHSGIRKTECFTVGRFDTWPILNEFEVDTTWSARPVLVKPDGFILIHEKAIDGSLSAHTFFLEVDRSTEVQERLATRAACYVEYYRSGGFAVRNGAPPSAHTEYPFRVLMIFRNAERRNNTAKALLQNNPPIFTQVYLSTLDEAKVDPLGEIWIRPIDYRDALVGTRFEAQRAERRGVYRRNTERELLVEAKVKKVALLADTGGMPISASK